MAKVKKKINAGAEVPAEKPTSPITANRMCRSMLLERCHTDDEIADAIQAVFPDKKFPKAYVSTTRIDLNKGYYARTSPSEEIKANPLVRLIRDENGKLIQSTRKLRKSSSEVVSAEVVPVKKAVKKPAKVAPLQLPEEKATPSASVSKKKKPAKVAPIEKKPSAKKEVKISVKKPLKKSKK